MPGPSPAALSLLCALEGPMEQAATVCLEMLSRSADAGRRQAPLGRSTAQRPNAFPQREAEREIRAGKGETRAVCGEKGPLLPVVGPWDARFVEVRSLGPPPPPHLCLSAFSIHRHHRGVCDNDTQILRNNPAQCRHLLRMWG